jgi:hypothetical protein
MDGMRWGLGRRRRPRESAGEALGSAACAPDQPSDAFDRHDPAAELHFCCFCGASLDGDPEEEIDGEGPGRDVCGDCNRTKNYEAMMGNE